MNNKKLRNPALDIIRCIALFCVVSVHFFLNTDFYDKTVSGEYMLVMTIMRSSFMICVPLFIMLSGYLVRTKEVSRSYYLKIVRILYVYFFACILTGIFKICILKNGTTVFQAILNIFSFRAVSYCWYIEMYIGLFLIIPFLNIMYDALDTQKKKKILIATLLLCTALPGVINIYCVGDLAWFSMPSQNTDYNALIPDWWIDIYPITYFFLGKYIREFPMKLKAKQIAALIIGVFLFAGVFNYYRSYGDTFIWGPWQNNGSLLITLQTVLIFSFFVQLKYEKMPVIIRSFFSKVSELSLGAYLVSGIFDKIVYTKLNGAIPNMNEKLLWYPVVVLTVLTCSLVCSWLIDLTYSFTAKKLVNKYMNPS